jgi:hypothetical protein
MSAALHGPLPDGLRAALEIGEALWCNSGGPMSRTRKEPLFSTVLGDETGPIRCPRVLRVGLAFGRRKPVACAERWLRAAGFATDAGARAALTLPAGPRICQIDSAPQPVDAASLTPLEGLFFALVLGLCTPVVYDPARPLVWTTASLTRQLVLYDGRGFYA